MVANRSFSTCSLGSLQWSEGDHREARASEPAQRSMADGGWRMADGGWWVVGGGAVEDRGSSAKANASRLDAWVPGEQHIEVLTEPI